jgi:hypothetical protein
MVKKISSKLGRRETGVVLGKSRKVAIDPMGGRYIARMKLMGFIPKGAVGEGIAIPWVTAVTSSSWK